MTVEQSSRRRRFMVGCVLASTASLGLITFPLTYGLRFLSDAVVFPLVCALIVLMGVGATLAVFSLKHP